MSEIQKHLTEEEIKKIIYQELPRIIKTHPEIRIFIEDLLREKYADKKQTEDRFEKLLLELRELRKEYLELKKESQKRWEEVLNEIKRLHRLYDVGIGALGARWGLKTEASFREAIKGILEESFPVKVKRYLTIDKDGEVFGHPDQVELDLIIRDGEIIAREIKSSVSKADIYIFDRKVRLYEKKEKCQVKRKIIISPMVEPKALQVAEELDIEVYTYPDYIEEL